MRKARIGLLLLLVGLQALWGSFSLADSLEEGAIYVPYEGNLSFISNTWTTQESGYSISMAKMDADGIWDWSTEEDVEFATLEFISGDNYLKNVVYLGKEGDRQVLRYIIPANTKNGTATWLLKGVSKHYKGEQEITVHVVQAAETEISLKNNEFDMQMGETLYSYKLREKEVTVSPVPKNFINTYFQIPGALRVEEEEEDGYILGSWGTEFKPTSEGTYELEFSARTDSGYEVAKFPITIHVLSKEELDAAWEASWPPEGKKEAFADGNLWDEFFVIDPENAHWMIRRISLYPDAYSDNEDASNVHVTFIEGPEELERFMSAVSGDGDGAGVNFDMRSAATNGTATFRVDVESEHYYTSFEAKPKVILAENVQVDQLVQEITLPVGQEIWLNELMEKVLFFHVSPEMGNRCDLMAADEEGKAETDQYVLNWNDITLKQAGDYSFQLRLSLGGGSYEKFYPVTVHGRNEITHPIIHTSSGTVELQPTPEPTPIPTPTPALTQASEGTGTTEDGFAYEKTRYDNTLQITGGPDVEELVIPAEIDGTPVSLVDGFENHQKIKKLIISEGITTIDSSAFRRCTSLEEVVLPDSLTRIDNNAFADCYALEKVTFGAGLTSGRISSDAFAGIAAEDLVLADGTSLAAKTEEGLYLDDRYVTLLISTHTEDWDYLVLKDGTARIVRWNNYGDTVEIPAEINGHAVTELDSELMSGYSVRNIKLPEGLKKIGKSAFEDCTQLMEIDIPDSVTWIGARAFANIAKTDLTAPESVESLPIYWYSYGKKTDSTGEWEYEILPDDTTALTKWLGSGKTITVPQEVDGKTVRVYAVSYHENRDSITGVNLPDTIEVIDEGAFYSFDKLTSITLPANLKEIGCRAFYWTPMKKITLPEGLITIGSSAFENTSLTEIVFPESLQSIGNIAFNQTKIKKATFNGYHTQLGVGIFGYTSGALGGFNDPSAWRDVYAAKTGNTDKLTVVCYPGSTADQLYTVNVTKQYLKFGDETKITAPDAAVLTKDAFEGIEFISELTIPEGVEEIAEEALMGYSMMTKISLPSTLTKIGDRAFKDCTNLTEIKLGKNITDIGEEAFSGCLKLKKIDIPIGVTEIKKGTFYHCDALASVTLPKGLTAIGEDAFRESGIKSVKMTDSVTGLGEYAFAGCSNLTSVTLSKGLTEIPKLCFAGSGIKSITIPEGVTVIRERAFYYCDKLGQVKLPKGLEVIEAQAFAQNMNYVRSHYAYTRKAGATALKSVSFPASLKTIGEQAFADCDALATVTFAKDSQLQTIGDYAFADNLSLKQIEIPDSATEMGMWVFINGAKLAKVNLGAGMTKIGENAFAYCESMTSLIVPDTLTDIGASLLEGHGAKLVVTCGEGSTMESYMKQNYPDVTVAYPKKKK